MSEIWRSMELINPNNQKTWQIEIESESGESDRAIFRTCFNHGKIKEKDFQGTLYDRKNKYVQAIMEKMRKGYVYSNPQADPWNPCFHGYIDRPYSGFLPIAANQNRSDFYIVRIKKDFEDEIIYHYNEDGALLDSNSLGAQRITYRACLNEDGTIIFKERNYEIYNPDTKKLKETNSEEVAHTFDNKNDHSDSRNGVRVTYLGYDAPSCRGYFDIINEKDDQRMVRIVNEFTIQNAFCAFTKNRLIVHTDYGVLSIYKIKDVKTDN